MADSKQTPLSAKQQEFCIQYLIDLNGTQAAIHSGYSPRTANEQASRLLANVNIQEFISLKKQKHEDKLDISIERILTEYARLAYSDIRKFYTVDGTLKSIHELDDDCAAALAGVEVYEERISDAVDDEQIKIGSTKKIKTYDKTKALESLAKYVGMFEKDNAQKKVEVTPFTDSQVEKIISTLRGSKNT